MPASPASSMKPSSTRIAATTPKSAGTSRRASTSSDAKPSSLATTIARIDHSALVRTLEVRSRGGGVAGSVT